MITLQHVGKTYRRGLRRRPVLALDDLSLTLARGEVVGVAGPNGAGKSTLLSLLLGYLGPTTGQVAIDGRPPRRYVESFGASYLAELVAIPPRWTVRSALARYGTLAALPAATRADRVAQQLTAFGLEEHAAKRISAVSKGTLQRVGLAQALLRESDLVILDEPTHGLDPVWTQRFRDLIARLRRPDRLLLIASHNLTELERVTDRVVILHRGRLQRVVPSGDSTGAAGYRLELARPLRDPAALAAAGLADARPLGADGRQFLLPDDLTAANAMLGRLHHAGILVRAFGPYRGGLEDQFHDAVGAG